MLVRPHQGQSLRPCALALREATSAAQLDQPHWVAARATVALAVHGCSDRLPAASAAVSAPTACLCRLSDPLSDAMQMSGSCVMSLFCGLLLTGGKGKVLGNKNDAQGHQVAVAAYIAARGGCLAAAALLAIAAVRGCLNA